MSTPAVQSVRGVDAAELARLQEAVRQANIADEEASDRERQIWQTERQGPPPISLTPAQLKPPTPSHRPSSLGALLAALATALTSITGLAMISIGAAIEPTLTTVADLRNALAAPLVGVVPATELSPAPATHPVRRFLLRLALFALGALVLLSCAAMFVALSGR
jgi:hypothetical protein